MNNGCISKNIMKPLFFRGKTDNCIQNPNRRRNIASYPLPEQDCAPGETFSIQIDHSEPENHFTQCLSEEFRHQYEISVKDDRMNNHYWRKNACIRKF